MTRESKVGILVAVVVVVAALFANVIGSEEGESSGLVILGLFALAVTALLFMVIIPRAKAAPPEAGRPARDGIIASVVGLLSVAVFWTGLPYVLGAGGALLGQIGRERAQAGGRGLATAALVIGLAAFALAVVVAVGDEL